MPTFLAITVMLTFLFALAWHDEPGRSSSNKPVGRDERDQTKEGIHEPNN